ncbi:restriction endonuclease subunit S [Bacillus safensis]|nr:restriction endonuclease subunit S [Bacillus safensis]MEC2425458.1 restriction endonuclease subunit S [Bacillus safensis]
MSKKKKTIEELLGEALVLEEHPYKIPDNWIWVRLGYISNYIQRGKSPKYVEFSNVKVISQKCVQWSGFDITRARYINEETLKNYQKERFLQKNDLLWNSTGTGTIGRIALITDELEGIVVADSHVTVVRPENSVINSQLLYRWLSSPYVQNKLNNAWSGSTNQVELNLSTVKQHQVPLPPLNEQKRIAEKVERLLSKIEEAKQLIEEAKETFELRRAAILDKAFRGELTRKWRGENADITTANEWIEQINLLKEGTKTKYKDQLDSSILEKLYELPREWKWVRLNDLIEASTYGTSAKTNDDVTGTPVLRMGNIVDGYLELNNLKYLPNNHEDVLKYDLQTNDLLFNRTNSYELVGKTSVITEDVSERFTFASYLIRVRLFYKDFLASYVSHYINSHVGRKILLSMVTQQVGQANINSQKLASLPIPLPSQEEVMEITSWLNNYRELESKQKEMILVEENIEALKQSILSKAFRGELGTNDLGEESAIELLKDVLQEQVK